MGAVLRAEQTGQGLPWSWGTTADLRSPTGRARHQICDASAVRVATRAVETDATPPAIFVWLCQLRRAPYSYDWIDNFGRRSPRVADTSLTELAVGQSVMTIFTLTNFVRDESLTLVMKAGWPTRVFGALTVHYTITGLSSSCSVLRADLVLAPLRRAPLGRLLDRLHGNLLAWGDLLMMRKQLHVLTTLAEGTSSAAGAHARPTDGHS